VFACPVEAAGTARARDWFGYANRDGSLANRCVGGNYKGFFHVPRALLMCVQAADTFLAANAD
jgi:mannose/cellobiose epimerase-like protein (N-acyl-D-glucosamine 2-epimerase family)